MIMYYTPADAIPIREVFRYEPQDFTPWLAGHLDRLDRALGMELELVGYDEQLGTHQKRPDIVAEEKNLDTPVVIENQLKISDDDHLGRLLIYAANAKAGFGIWIAPEFRHEHMRAVEWINENSFESFQLFCVRVFAKQDSRPSHKVRFKVVTYPTQWSYEMKALSWDYDYLDNGMYRNFWQSLIQDQRITNFTAPKRMISRRYHYFYSGFGGIRYVVRFAPISETVSVSLAIARPERNEVFDQLGNDWEYIERTFGDELNWESSEYRKFHRIGVEEAGSIIDSTDETKRWMIDNLIRLKETFTPYLDELAR